MQDAHHINRESESEYIDRLVHINRVAKVVKGGRRFSFAALVVIGDQKGRVGFGTGKAREVPEAVKKATETARNTLIRVPLREGRTLHHDVSGKHGAGKVVLRSAPPGTGIIAGGPMRAVFESLGMQDVVAKSIGTANPYNMLRATFNALKKECSPQMVASRRSKKVRDINARRWGTLPQKNTGIQEKHPLKEKTQAKSKPDQKEKTEKKQTQNKKNPKQQKHNIKAENKKN